MVVLLNLMVKKRLSHGGKEVSFLRLNGTITHTGANKVDSFILNLSPNIDLVFKCLLHVHPLQTLGSI